MQYKESIFNISIPYNDCTITYNTYSGSLIILEKAIKEWVKENPIDDLVDQGILVPNEIDEINRLIIDRKCEIFTTQTDVLHIEISPTLKCQASCWYCFEKDKTQNTMNDEIVLSTIKYIEKKINESNCSKVSLLFFGGEPFLAYEQMLNISNAIKKKCEEREIEFSIKIITNGIAMTIKRIETMLSQFSIEEIQVTLDGLENTHNSNKGINCFSTVINNIQEICDRVKVRVRINVSKTNKGEIKALLKYLFEEKELAGRITAYLARVDDADTTLDCNMKEDVLKQKEFALLRDEVIEECLLQYNSYDLNELLPEVKRHYCGYERVSQIMIGPLGEIYHCQRDLGAWDKSIGHITIGEFYNDYSLFMCSEINEQCMDNCELLPICYGGCPHDQIKTIDTECCLLKKDIVKNDIKKYIYEIERNVE